MRTLGGILLKICSKTMYPIYIRGSLLRRSLISPMHSSSTTPLIALPSFHVLNCKQYYRLLEFLNDTLVYMEPEVLNI